MCWKIIAIINENAQNITHKNNETNFISARPKLLFFRSMCYEIYFLLGHDSFCVICIEIIVITVKQ
jgi:hypothetical protein